jgi:hypothetical protein
MYTGEGRVDPTPGGEEDNHFFLSFFYGKPNKVLFFLPIKQNTVISVLLLSV